MKNENGLVVIKGLRDHNAAYHALVLSDKKLAEAVRLLSPLKMVLDREMGEAVTGGLRRIVEQGSPVKGAISPDQARQHLTELGLK